MNRKIVLAITLIIVLFGMLGTALIIEQGKASGTTYIRANGEVEGTDKIQRNGDVYTFTENIYDSMMVERSNIIIDGAGHTVEGSGSGIGISLTRTNNVTIKRVCVQNFTEGIYFDYSSNNNLYENSIIGNNGRGILLSSFSVDNAVFGNTITNNGEGIRLGSSGNKISGNNITNNNYGVWFDSSNNTISQNNITENKGIALYILNSMNSTIYRNNITNNENDGVSISYSSNIQIHGNRITNNDGHGVSLGSSNNNVINRNDVANNSGAGVELKAYFYLRPSSNNTIDGNRIENNTIGIKLSGSSGNSVYHNDFKNNGQQVYDDYPWNEPSLNIWDNDAEGNYWSNYIGIDSNYDGIGDTEHFVDTNNQDNYPLIGMFYSLATPYNNRVNIICNSSVSDFDFSVIFWRDLATLSFNVAEQSGTHGFCRICIPKALINGSYVVRFNGEIITTMTYPGVRELPCSDETYEYLYINYTHSEQTIEISGTTTIPEFPSLLILPLFMLATLLAVIVYRRKHSTKLHEPPFSA